MTNQAAKPANSPLFNLSALAKMAKQCAIVGFVALLVLPKASAQRGDSGSERDGEPEEISEKRKSAATPSPSPTPKSASKPAASPTEKKPDKKTAEKKPDPAQADEIAAIPEPDPLKPEIPRQPRNPAKPSERYPPGPKPPGAAAVSVKQPQQPFIQEASKKFPKTVTKLMIDDLQTGRGRGVKPGAKLAVHFTSWLYDPTQPLGRGPQFESTQGKQPYRFVLQSKDSPHIRGWDEGILEMKPGGRRRLIIPPDMAYGAAGAGQEIPANATLLYEIELIEIE